MTSSFNQRRVSAPDMPSSFDYLYRAIALIEAKNGLQNQTQPTQVSDLPTSNDYSSSIAMAAQNNLNTRRILGNLLYQNNNIQPSLHQSELISPLFSQFNTQMTESPRSIEEPCTNNYCHCKSSMSKISPDTNKSTSRLEKAKEFARRANSIGGSCSDTSESCSDSVYGSSHDDESKESPSPSTANTTPSPLAASSPINNYSYYPTNTRHVSPPPPPPPTNPSGVTPLDLLSNLLPVYLNSYLQTLSQSLVNPVPPSTQDQVAYIQNLIDLINTVTSYQQQQQQMRTIYNALTTQPQTQFPTASISPIISSSPVTTTSIPVKPTFCQPSSSSSNRIPMVRKERPSLIKKKSTLKPASKTIKAKLGNNTQSPFVLNLNHIKHTLVHSTSTSSTSSSSLSSSSSSPNDQETDVYSKVDEHFRRSLGNNYLKCMMTSSSQS